MRWISHAGGVTETSGNFANDTSMSYPEVEAFAEAYERNMETLYDNIVEQGGYVSVPAIDSILR